MFRKTDMTESSKNAGAAMPFHKSLILSWLPRVITLLGRPLVRLFADSCGWSEAAVRRWEMSA